MRLRPMIVFMCLAMLRAHPAAAQASGSALMTGTVLTAITITGSDLSFGNVMSSDSKRVAAPLGGRFVVTMAAATPVTIAYALPASLGPQVTLSAWELLSNSVNDGATAQAIPVGALNGSFTASTPTGSLYLWVGATVTTVGAGVGSYSQPITLTVTYN
jgi:hypothetical protein